MMDQQPFYESDDEDMEDMEEEEEEEAEVDVDVDPDPVLMSIPAEADDATTPEGDDDSGSDDSDDDEEEEEEDDDDEPLLDLGLTDEGPLPPKSPSPAIPAPQQPMPAVSRKRSLSPSQVRRKAIAFGPSKGPRTFIIEAICALPHPTPTHALASSSCMLHLLTGSDDGYIRDYDIFPAVNGKNYLTAPQRHHSNVVEGLMKSGQLRCWWENPTSQTNPGGVPQAEEQGLAPVYSLAMQGDALWTLSGTDGGYVNLFTVRHDPGKLVHVLNGHKGPVSSLCLDYDEKGFFSGGWDGDAIQWDLNTGHPVRRFTAHGAQIAGVAVRPISNTYFSTPQTVKTETVDVSMASPGDLFQADKDTDARSDASFDPLFDDEPEDQKPEEGLAIPGAANSVTQPPARPRAALQVPKGAPPLLDPASYQTYSPDLLMTAHIDGQVILWDRRVNGQSTPGKGVGRLWMNEKTPPWCLSACWSADGGQLFAGRRNGTVDVWDVRLMGTSGISNTPRLLKTIRNPPSSGVVSCVVAFPDGRHMACASVDNIRLWNVAESPDDSMMTKPKGGIQFKIIPGHHGGYISQMLVDSGCRFLVSASSNRGWHGESTRTVFVHDIKWIA